MGSGKAETLSNSDFVQCLTSITQSLAKASDLPAFAHSQWDVHVKLDRRASRLYAYAALRFLTA